MELDELKQFLRVDGTDLDIVLTGYQSAAEVYLLNAGVIKDYTNALYKTVITVFCGVMLENPNLSADRKGNAVFPSVTLNCLIDQLRKSQVTV